MALMFTKQKYHKYYHCLTFNWQNQVTIFQVFHNQVNYHIMFEGKKLDHLSSYQKEGKTRRNFCISIGIILEKNGEM